MNKQFALILTLLVCFSGYSQHNSDELEIEQAIRTFFEGFHKQDSLIMQSVLFETAHLQTIGFKKESNEVKIEQESVSQFLKSIVSIPKEVSFREEIHGYSIQSDGLLATAWTPYSFYINESLSHFGANNFQLVKEEGKWKIFSIVDTRKREDCTD
jgi:hypothetical protein